jgi:hypothetical protein
MRMDVITAFFNNNSDIETEFCKGSESGRLPNGSPPASASFSLLPSLPPRLPFANTVHGKKIRRSKSVAAPLAPVIKKAVPILKNKWLCSISSPAFK